MLTLRCVKCKRIKKTSNVTFYYTRKCALNERHACLSAGSRRGTGQGTGVTLAAQHC